MPRIRKPIERANLPTAYQKFTISLPDGTPIPFPIPGSKDTLFKLKSKDVLVLTCDCCHQEHKSTLDNITSLNKQHRHGTACPFCTAALDSYEKFNGHFLGHYGLKIINHSVNTAHKWLNDNRRSKEAIVYTVKHTDCDTTYELTHLQVREACQISISDIENSPYFCTHCLEEKKEKIAIEKANHLEEKFADCDTVKRAREYWGVDIKYDGQDESFSSLSKDDNAQFKCAIPGLPVDANGEISIETFDNKDIKGRIRGRLEGIYNKRWIDGELNRHEKDLRTIECIRTKSAKFGAQIEYIGFSDRGHIMFRYMSALDILSHLQTAERCEENGFGEKAATNQKLTIRERSQQLEKWGMKLLFDNPNKLITVESIVTRECVACGYQSTGFFGNMRQRGCPVCKSTFGEKLLFNLIKHYVQGYEPGTWLREFPVKKLDPDNPSLVLRFDWACPSLKAAFENHSDYHETEHSRFHDKVSLAERRKRDLLKTVSSEGGTHVGGPLNGWGVGIVWFSADDCRKKGINGDFLPVVIQEFKNAAKKLGLPLKPDASEISYADIYRAVEGPTVLAAMNAGFDRLGPYLGETQEYVWQHKCQGKFQAPAAEIINLIALGKTGCRWCDREGHPGHWLKFLDRLAAFDILIKEEFRFEIVTEHNEVSGLICEHHPNEDIDILTRCKWTQRLINWEKKKADPLTYKPRLALCRECSKTIKPEPKRSPKFAEWKTKFAIFGYTLLDAITPCSVDSKGKQRSTIGVLSCNLCGSGPFEIDKIPQKFQKASDRRLLVCPKTECENHSPRCKKRLRSLTV